MIKSDFSHILYFISGGGRIFGVFLVFLVPPFPEEEISDYWHTVQLFELLRVTIMRPKLLAGIYIYLSMKTYWVRG